jgi:acetyl-CoA synthetase
MTDWHRDSHPLTGLHGDCGLNIGYEAVDRHVAAGDGARIALRFLDRAGGVRVMTYADLARLSNRFAAAITAAGIMVGDRVFSLAGRIPELYVAALGTWKAGAVFCPLFAAFGPEPIRIRLAKGDARMLLTTTALYRRRIAGLRPSLPGLGHIVVVGDADPGTISYDAMMAAAADDFRIPATDPEQPALVQFTSGTTGTPKGAFHVHAAVTAHAATGRLALGLGVGDTYWCTADPGWITGIVYGVIAPLVLGATSVVDAADFDAERWLAILEAERVAVWYTAPTAIRMLMRSVETGARHLRLPALRTAASVGEPLHAEAVLWGERVLGTPLRDTWWQTETGAIMIANAAGQPVRPGAMGRPLPAVDAAVVHHDRDGTVSVLETPDTVGELALRAGWPSMFRGYLGEPERYARCFAGGWYLSGDLVRRDAEGFFRFVGRGDDVIKSAGHLIGPAEVEGLLMAHPAVADVGVIGVPDPLIGESVKAFVATRRGVAGDDDLRRQLLAFARRHLGPAVAPRAIDFVADVPKTRSGKILRRLLRARELGLPEGDTSTLEGAADG